MGATRAAQILLVAHAAFAMHDELPGSDCAVTEEHPGLCALTACIPKRPRYLKFCQDYNAEAACCIPGHDLENQIQFENLIEGLGPGCKNPMMYPNIRYFYCLGCDPDQPMYTDENDNVHICEDFITKLWDDYRPQYEECGVMRSNECPEGFDDFDPYTCGDDLVIPPHEYASGVEFMNAFKPPGMDDFNFVASNSSSCWKPVFMRSSAAGLSSSATVGVMLLGAALRRLL